MPTDKSIRNAQNRPARERYEAKTYRRYTIRVRQDGGDGFTPEQLEDAARRAGQSVNAWIIDAIKDKIYPADSQERTKKRPLVPPFPFSP